MLSRVFLYFFRVSFWIPPIYAWLSPVFHRIFAISIWQTQLLVFISSLRLLLVFAFSLRKAVFVCLYLQRSFLCYE